MTAKFTVLGNTTLATASASVTFSSIPSGYKDLVVIVDALGSGGDAAIFLRFNSDTGSNYSYVTMSGNGSTSNSTNGTLSFVLSGIAATTTQRAIANHQISDYSTTNKHKTLLTRGNNANGLGTYAVASRWANTAAINAIEVYTGSNSYAIGSTFRLLGVN
jgi:hypothetical protein